MISKKKIAAGSVLGIIGLVCAFYFFENYQARSIVVEGSAKPIVPGASTYNVLVPPAAQLQNPQPNSLTGGPCPDGIGTDGKLLRPIGVMLAADPSTRPLSGIAQADIVVEMPVINRGINRFLALFQCVNATDIGSIRSARDDFIPLAAGFDALYAHWGGSHFALDILKNKVIDNIDALQNPHGAYYRKKGIRSPDNGFSSIDRLRNTAANLHYRLSQNDGYGYARLAPDGLVAPAEQMKLTINYPDGFGVSWLFDPQKKTYIRSRGGKPEIDKNTNAQVEAPNVIVIKTTSRQLEGQYNDVKVTGAGDAIIYRAGKEIKATWGKDGSTLSSRLRFVDEQGNEIPLAPGKIWLEYIDQVTTSSYTPL